MLTYEKEKKVKKIKIKLQFFILWQNLFCILCILKILILLLQ